MAERFRSRAPLFLIEQLIVILVFAICAAVCVNIFVGAYTTAAGANDLSNAALAAESGAECFKAARGSADVAARLLNAAAADNGEVIVFYDESWNICRTDGASFLMRLKCYEGVPAKCDITVESISGEEIFAITAAANARFSAGGET